MHDINGKVLHIGTEIHTYSFGMCRITSIKEEHDPHKGGALIGVVSLDKGGGESELRTHEAKVTKVRTWKELAELALQVQDGGNLPGIVRSFSEAANEVRYRLESEGKGSTEEVWAHPVCVLFSNKISSLTSSESPTIFSNAYTWASNLKEGKVR